MTRHSHCTSCASTDSGSSAASPSSSSSSGSSKSRKTKTPKKQQQVKKADGTPLKRQVKKLENNINDEEAVKLEQAQPGQELDSSEMIHDTQSDAGTEDIVVSKLDDVEHEVESVPSDSHVGDDEKPADSEVVPEVEELVELEVDGSHDVEPPAIDGEEVHHERDGGESSCDENEDVNVMVEDVEAAQELDESETMHHEADPEHEVPSGDEGEVTSVDAEVVPLEKETVEGSDSWVGAIAVVPAKDANAADENGESSSDEKEEDIVFLFNKSAGDDGGVKESGVEEEKQDEESEKAAENISQVIGIKEQDEEIHKERPPAEIKLWQVNSEQVKPEETAESPVEVEDILDTQLGEVVGSGDAISENERRVEDCLVQEENKSVAVLKSEGTLETDDSEGEKSSIEDSHLLSVVQRGQGEEVGDCVPVREDGTTREKMQSLKIDLPSSDSDTDREHNEHVPTEKGSKVSTPSPPKRDREGSSVYKIVKALEGLQVGEKCVHGEIDHGLCHERKVRASSPASHTYTVKVPRTPEEYRRLASSPADYSGHSRTRDSVGSGTKLHKEPVEHRGVGKLSEFSPFQKQMATPEANNTVESRDGGRKKEVNSEKTFVQYDSHMASPSGYTASSTVETYSDTVILKREDGFVAGKDSRTPVLKEIFENGVESGSTHLNKLKIVHEFPAEKGEGIGYHHDGEYEEHTLASAEFAGEFEVERILRLQETHDLICPNCRSCITKRVILRKRKRTTTVVVNTDRWEVPEEEAEDIVEDNFLVGNNVEDIAVVEEYEDWGCSACFTWLFRRVRGTRSTQPVQVVPEIGESIVTPSPIVVPELVQPTEQPGASEILELPGTPRSQRSDNSCLPILFIWRRKTTVYPESDIVTPLLANRREEQTAVQSPEVDEQVVTVDVARSKELPPEKDDETELSHEKIQSPEIQEDSVFVESITDASELPAEKTQVSEDAETAIAMDNIESPELAPEMNQISEIQEHTGKLPLVKEVRIPVAVIESSEDRLCFPFIWRRRETKNIHLPSSDLQEPLLVKKEEQEGNSENNDYSQIPEELWYRGEEVAVSIAPEDPSAGIPPPDVVTVAPSERQSVCNCLPGLSWGRSERVQDQTGKSEVAALSEISASPVSLESEEVVIQEASGTPENDKQKASLSCIDILLPAYPWGPKGGALIQDIPQVPIAPGVLNITVPDVNLEKSSPTVEWSTVTQYLGEGSMKVESREFNITDLTTVDRQPPHEDEDVGKTSARSEPTSKKGLEPVDAAQDVEVREASKCLPLVLPSLSWRRRQDRKTGEVLQETSSAGGRKLVEERKETISGEGRKGTAEWSTVTQYSGDGSMKVESREFNITDMTTVDRQPPHEDEDVGKTSARSEPTSRKGNLVLSTVDRQPPHEDEDVGKTSARSEPTSRKGNQVLSTVDRQPPHEDGDVGKTSARSEPTSRQGNQVLTTVDRQPPHEDEDVGKTSARSEPTSRKGNQVLTTVDRQPPHEDEDVGKTSARSEPTSRKGNQVLSTVDRQPPHEDGDVGKTSARSEPTSRKDNQVLSTVDRQSPHEDEDVGKISARSEPTSRKGNQVLSTVDRQPPHEDEDVGKTSARSEPTSKKGLEPVDVAQDVEVREASKCLPLVLPSLSWRRRQDRKTGEVLQETSSAGGRKLVEERKETISGEGRKGTADVEVSRSVDEDSKPNYQIDLEDDVEDEPLVRRSPVIVQQNLIDEGKNLPSVSLATQDSSISEDLTPTYDSFFWDSLPEEPIPGLRPVIKEKEEGSLETSKPVVISGDILEDIIPRYGGMQYKEVKEMGSWDCCLPFYTQRHIHIIDERPLDKSVAPEVTDTIAEGKGRVVTEEVLKETTVDARVTTTTTTVQSSHDPTCSEEERVDAIKVDTSVSYVHSSVQEDQDAVVDRNEISKAAGQPVLSEHVGHDDEKSLGLITEILDDIGQKRRNRTMGQETVGQPVQPVLSEHGGHDDEKSLGFITEISDDSGQKRTNRTMGQETAGQPVQPVLSEHGGHDDEKSLGLITEILDDIGQKRRNRTMGQETAGQPVLSEHGGHDDEKSLGLITEILDDIGQKRTNRTVGQETASEEARESAIDFSQPVQAEETQRKAGSSDCCLPLTAAFPKWQWGRRVVSAEDSQLREPLLPQGDDVVHVTVQQSHSVTETRDTPRLGADPATDVKRLLAVDDDTACSICLPWSKPHLIDLSTSETETTVTVTTDDTVLEVEGRDAEDTLLAAREAAEDAGMVMHETTAPAYLKSIVYGGLDVSLTSLGVVASAAGGDAKTRNVIALGLANLVFGFIAFYHKIQDLHKESPSRFRESVGPSYWVNGFLALVSFLIFGALPPLMFGFTFRESNDHDYKMGATVIASVIAITLLGCGKVASKMTELSYKRTISTLILTGVAAAVAGFYTGEYISKLLDKYGIFSD